MRLEEPEERQGDCTVTCEDGVPETWRGSIGVPIQTYSKEGVLEKMIEIVKQRKGITLTEIS